MLDFVREHPILKDTLLVAYGQSIGGAVAIDLVSRNEDSFAGLIIENTFLSLVSCSIAASVNTLSYQCVFFFA